MIYNKAKKEREIWKDIPEYKGCYQASTFGKIKSLSRKYSQKERILKFYFDKQYKYLQCSLSKNNKPKMCRVHQLILLTFQGKCPKGMECCHNDGVRTNNYYSNLRYDTRKNNHADKKLHGTDNRGEKNGYSKLTKENVISIKRLLRTKCFACVDLAKIFDVNRVTISVIKHNKSWSWLKTPPRMKVY